eukprot:UN32028
MVFRPMILFLISLILMSINATTDALTLHIYLYPTTEQLVNEYSSDISSSVATTTGFVANVTAVQIVDAVETSDEHLVDLVYLTCNIDSKFDTRHLLELSNWKYVLEKYLSELDDFQDINVHNYTFFGGMADTIQSQETPDVFEGYPEVVYIGISSGMAV